MEDDILLSLSNEPLGGSEDRSSTTYSVIGKGNSNVCTGCIKKFLIGLMHSTSH